MKYFIVGMHSSGKQELFELLTKQNISCGKLFSNVCVNDIRYDFFSDTDLVEIFENKAYIFMKEVDDFSRNSYECLSLYEYDNNSVMILSPDQFTAIPQQFFTEDICLVWLDDSKGIRKQRYDEEKRSYNFNEKEEFERRELDEFIKIIYNNKRFKVLYFTNEDIARVSSIVYALVKYPDLVENFEKTYK
jgi:hypothetical protein